MTEANEFFPPTQSKDNEQLKLLSVFHYVVSGIAFLFACFPVIHLVIGLVIVFAPGQMGHGAPPKVMGLFFAGFAVAAILLGWAFAAAVLLAGRFLARRRHFTYCFVVACLECMFIPFGTVLGIFTILVLVRSSVKEQFVPKPAW